MTVPRRGGCPGARTSQRLPTGMALAWASSSMRRWELSASRCARSSSLYRPSLLRFRKERTESVGGVGWGGGQTWSPGWGGLATIQNVKGRCAPPVFQVTPSHVPRCHTCLLPAPETLLPFPMTHSCLSPHTYTDCLAVQSVPHILHGSAPYTTLPV